MRSGSGLVLSSEAVVNVRVRRGVTRGDIRVMDHPIAEIQSRFVKTGVRGLPRARSTTLTFPDGTRWQIDTGMPRRSVVFPKPKGGRVHERLRNVRERVVRVVDERDGSVLASASWPDRKEQRKAIRKAITQHGPNPVERAVGWLLNVGTTAPRIEVGSATMWYVPTPVPGRATYGKRLGDVLIVLSGWGGTKLQPTSPTPLEAALLCWHLESGDIPKPST